MKDSRTEHFESPATSAQVDAVCDEFEAAWLAGQEPRIEDFLPRVGSVDQSGLLRELLLAEWDLHRRHGQRPELPTYLGRFPECTHSITDLWCFWTEKQSERTPDPRPHHAEGNRLQNGSRLVGRYIIAEAIGAGGMGEVYRALDTQLDRDVAIKVLSLASLDYSQMQERFKREVKSVAGLSHPNIVTLYDIGQDGDLTFAVMELVDGKTLRQLISAGIGWPLAGQIACGIAEGLSAAHARNIMHRDIKPENVIVSTSGRVKILDFGLARTDKLLLDQQLTDGGFIPGTIPYMSPEQAAGEELTCLTDVFSLGTVLFEMVTGTNPFREDSELATLQNISAFAPPSIASFEEDIPTEVDSLVMSMLQKLPEHRPAAKEVANRLQQLTADSGMMIRLETPAIRVVAVEAARTMGQATSDAAAGPPTIAVLPLHNLTANASARLFGDAIAQEIIVDLSKLHSLFVIARGSSFQFRGPSIDMSEISRVLGARYLLTGTIELLGNQSAVTVELSYAPQRRVVWAERFEGGIEDLPALRHTISGRVAVEIESRVHITEVERALKLSTENLDAWSAYHRGLWHMYRFNRHDNDIAAQMFQHAIGKDPHFARAYAGLSFTNFQDAFVGYSDDIIQRRDFARKHAEKSLELDPHDPFVNLTMGRSAWLHDNLDDAALWLDRSLELSPNYAFALYNRALIDNLLNNGSGAEQGSTKAMTLSPIDPLRYGFFGSRALSHVVRGDYPAATLWADKAIREPTAHVHIYSIAAMSHALAGNHDTAKKLTERVQRMDPDYSQRAFFRVFQFRDPQTIAAIQSAFHRLGM